MIAEFDRKDIDATRPAECACEVPAAQPYYDEYHNTLRNFVDEIRAENGGLGLLSDIHGTRVLDDDPADFYSGTDNGNWSTACGGLTNTCCFAAAVCVEP